MQRYRSYRDDGWIKKRDKEEQIKDDKNEIRGWRLNERIDGRWGRKLDTKIGRNNTQNTKRGKIKDLRWHVE